MIEILKPKCGHRYCAPEHCRFEARDDYYEEPKPREPSDGLSPEDRERRSEWMRERSQQ